MKLTQPISPTLEREFRSISLPREFKGAELPSYFESAIVNPSDRKAPRELDKRDATDACVARLMDYFDRLACHEGIISSSRWSLNSHHGCIGNVDEISISRGYGNTIAATLNQFRGYHLVMTDVGSKFLEDVTFQDDNENCFFQFPLIRTSGSKAEWIEIGDRFTCMRDVEKFSRGSNRFGDERIYFLPTSYSQDVALNMTAEIFVDKTKVNSLHFSVSQPGMPWLDRVEISVLENEAQINQVTLNTFDRTGHRTEREERALVRSDLYAVREFLSNASLTRFFDNDGILK